MSDRDDMAADWLADREAMPCQECAGTGWVIDREPMECPICGGAGEWEGWP